jgi:hypothetical protein
MLEEAAHNRQMKNPEYQKDPKGYFNRLRKEHDERAAQWRAKWRPAET